MISGSSTVLKPRLTVAKNACANYNDAMDLKKKIKKNTNSEILIWIYE